MEINTTKRFVENSSVQEHTEFKMRASAKAFDLVIAKLYSDKIKAFVRELSTNAYEAHQMVGNEQRPIDITIPTYNQSNFIVRDYGPGISPEDIKGIYTVVFESTKDSSNDVGGCFGLGSKSPFAYVENTPFSVTSIYQGKKYFYSCYRNEISLPCMDLLQVIDTTEESGVEVSVPIRRNDYLTVQEKCAEVYSWFDVKPNIKSGQRLSYRNHTDTVVMKETDFEIHSISSINFVKMGNILYPIDYNLVKTQKNYYGAIIYAPIGSVVPDPSRERLSYEPITLAYLQQKVEDINAYLADKVTKDVAAAKNYYEAMKLARKYTSSFPNMTIKQIQWNGKHFGDSRIQLTNCTMFNIDYRKKMRNQDTYKEFSYNDEQVLFLVNDAVGYKIRVNDYIRQHHISKVIVCEPSQVQLLCDEIGIDPSYFILASSLPYVAPLKGTTRGTGNGHKTRVLKYKGIGNGTDSWEDCQIDIVNDSGLYVEYFNNKCKHTNGLHYPAEVIPSALKMLGLPDNTVVYGIKSELLQKRGKDIKKMENLLTKAAAWYSNNTKSIEQKVKSFNTLKELDTRFISRLRKVLDNQKLSLTGNFSNFFQSFDSLDKDTKYCASIAPAVKTICGVDIYKTVGNDINFVTLFKKLGDKYKLLKEISQWVDEDGKELKFYLLGKGL